MDRAIQGSEKLLRVWSLDRRVNKPSKSVDDHEPPSTFSDSAFCPVSFHRFLPFSSLAFITCFILNTVLHRLTHLTCCKLMTTFAICISID